MSLETKLEIKCYKSCKTLPLFNFYEILNTNNFFWLIKGYDGEGFLKVDSDLTAIWENIYTEYNDLFQDGKDTKKYTLVAQMTKMEEEITVITLLLDLFLKRPSEVLAFELKEWGYDVDDINKAIKKLEALQFKLSIFKSKNRDLIEEKKEDDNEKKVHDLYKDIVAVESALGESKTIDPYTTVVSKWVNQILLAQKRSQR